MWIDPGLDERGNMAIRLCQSCGAPLEDETSPTYPQHIGTDADGSLTFEYCSHCYRDGHYVNEKLSLERMIEINLTYMTLDEMREMAGAGVDASEEDVRAEVKTVMRKFLLTLKRWR